MPLPTRSDVHVNAALTNMSVGWYQEETGRIADQAFPKISVSHQSDKYFEWDRKDLYRIEARERAPGTKAARAGARLTTSTYSCRTIAYAHETPWAVKQNQDAGVDMDVAGGQIVTQQLIMKREKDWADSYFKTGIWGTTKTGAAAASSTEVKYWNRSGSTPIADLRAGITKIKLTGYKANLVVLGSPVWDIIVDHADFLGRINGGATVPDPAIFNEDLLARILGVKRVLVADLVENTAKEGAAESLDFILGKHALICHAAPKPGLMVPSAGYSFVWSGKPGANSEGIAIDNYADRPTKTDIVEGEYDLDMKLVAASLGYFFASVVE